VQRHESPHDGDLFLTVNYHAPRFYGSFNPLVNSYPMATRLWVYPLTRCSAHG